MILESCSTHYDPRSRKGLHAQKLLLQDNVCLVETNVGDRVEHFVQQAQGLNGFTRGNDVMFTMGTDFTYSNALLWYTSCLQVSSFSTFPTSLMWPCAQVQKHGQADPLCELGWARECVLLDACRICGCQKHVQHNMDREDRRLLPLCGLPHLLLDRLSHDLNSQLHIS